MGAAINFGKFVLTGIGISYMYSWLHTRHVSTHTAYVDDSMGVCIVHTYTQQPNTTQHRSLDTLLQEQELRQRIREEQKKLQAAE